MTVRRVGAAQCRRKSKLSTSSLAKLRSLVAEHGYEGAGKIAGASEQTVEELASGGFAMARTVERLEASLSGVSLPPGSASGDGSYTVEGPESRPSSRDAGSPLADRESTSAPLPGARR